MYRMVRLEVYVLIRMCGLAVYLYFDSLVWLAVDKQVQEGNNTVGFLFVSFVSTNLGINYRLC